MSIFSNLFTTVSTNAKSAIGLLCALVIFMVGDCTRTNEMAPTLPEGSWTWSSSRDAYQIGDVVWIRDPIDNTTQHPMRILAIEGDTIQYLNDGFLLNDRRIAVLDMREWSVDSRIWKETFYPSEDESEALDWEIIQSNSNSNWKSSKNTIPPGHVYVSCDNRYKCLDSRWWGSLPISSIEGKISFGMCPFCKVGLKKSSFVLYY